jgi:hypothetical protein
MSIAYIVSESHAHYTMVMLKPRFNIAFAFLICKSGVFFVCMSFAFDVDDQ